MKKLLLAMAAVGVTTTAAAELAVGGSIAVGVQNTTTAEKAKLDLSDADINFAAKEDLGGGMSVAAGTSISNEGLRGGNVTVNNTSLTLDGGFGTLDYRNVLSGSAKLSAGVSVEDDMSDLMGGYSTVNVASYTLPAIAGVRVGIEYAADDAAALEISGTPNVVGTLTAGGVTLYGETGGASKEWDVRASADVAGATVAVRTTKVKMTELAVSAPVGPLTVGWHYAKKENGDKANGLAASYALSKSTSVVAGYVTGNGNGFDGNNYRVQLKTTF